MMWYRGGNTMGTVRTYEDLDVWHLSIDLAEMVYILTRKLPSEEKFALGDQMRRAAVSIPSNIAEGQSRSSTGDYIRFLSFAKGSNSEIHTQLLLGVRLGYFTKEQVEKPLELCGRIRRMLNSLISSLKKKNQTEYGEF